MNSFVRSKHVFHSPGLHQLISEVLAFFDSTPVYALPPSTRFAGTGVYALYYRGDFETYEEWSSLNKDLVRVPLYVGKAVPPGWRRGRVETTREDPALYRRLREHARSIVQSENLRLQDFLCRFVILEGHESDLIGSVEAAMIRRHNPLWNSVIDGFGNHDPGSGRYDQARSEWDVLHPGRPWADKLRGESPKITVIRDKIGTYTLGDTSGGETT